MSFAELNSDLKIYYELSGSGQTIVLISGYRGDHALWECIQPKLATHFQVLVFDNLGIGQTVDAVGDLTIEKMADATIELIDNLKLKHPHIVGQSMGGAIAQVIAKKYPEKINKLVLLNTAMKFNTATVINLENILKLQQIDIPFDVLLNLGLPWIFSSDFLALDTNINAHKERIVNNPYPQSIENQERQLKALKIFDSIEWIQTINHPTLVIASKNDIVTLPSESKQLAGHMRQATLEMVSGGHASIFECPGEISQLLINYFKLTS